MELKKITTEEFGKFSRLINETSGIYLRDNKISLLNNRLQRRLKEMAFTSFSQYYDYIMDSRGSGELDVVLNLISTNETFFFRNMNHFTALEQKILPELLAKGRPTLRILSAGCSTGEEPLTLAMIMDEKGWLKQYDVEIDAVDISSAVLEQAKSGYYPMKSFSNMPAHYREKYFDKVKDGLYRIKKRFELEIKYSRFNLKKDCFFKSYDLILCRNVMIYFDKENQESLINKFYEALNRDSYLIIGHSESLYFLENKFKYSKVIEAPVYYKE